MGARRDDVAWREVGVGEDSEKQGGESGTDRRRRDTPAGGTGETTLAHAGEDGRDDVRPGANPDRTEVGGEAGDLAGEAGAGRTAPHVCLEADPVDGRLLAVGESGQGLAAGGAADLRRHDDEPYSIGTCRVCSSKALPEAIR